MFRKPVVAIVALAMFTLTFTSCQREGCPGQITKADVVVVEQC